MARGSGGAPVPVPVGDADGLADGAADEGATVVVRVAGAATSPSPEVADPIRETPQTPMTRASTTNATTMPRASLDSSLVSGSAGTSGAGGSRPSESVRGAVSGLS